MKCLAPNASGGQARFSGRAGALVRVSLGITTALVLSACDRNDEVQVYKIAKEKAAPKAAASHDHSHGTERGALPSLTWKVPAGWEEAAPGEMRLASFRVRGKDSEQADVGVFPLPGMAGTDVDNVNRWRGQVGQPALSAEELDKGAEAVSVDGMVAKVYEQAGENPGSGEKTRILGAILRREGVAWFFKMTGPDELVAQQRPAFREFLESLKFSEAKTELPPDHPPINMSAAPAASSSSSGEASQPRWQVPEGWTEAPAGQFLVAKFGLPGVELAKASVNVSMSTGDGGGLAGNVNRWRRQLGLPDVSEEDIRRSVTAVETQGGKASLVELSGTDARSGEKAKVIGALVPRQGRTWFYKLMGPEAAVEQQRDSFVGFIRSATYPNVP